MESDSTIRNRKNTPRTADGRSGTLESIGERLRQQRTHSQRFLSAQRERLDRIEYRLLHDLTGINERLDQWLAFESDVEHRHEEWQIQDRDLARKAAHLERQHDELAQKRDRLASHLRERRASMRANQADMFTAKEEELDKLRRQLYQEREAAAHAQSQYEQSVREAADRDDERQRINAELRVACQALDELRQQETDLRRKLQDAEQRATAQQQLENELRTSLQSLSELRDQEGVLRQKLRDAEERVAAQQEIECELRTAQQSVEELRNREGKLRQKLQQAEERSNTQDTAGDELRAARQSLEELRDRETDLRQELQAAKDQVAAQQETESELHAAQQSVEELRNREGELRRKLQATMDQAAAQQKIESELNVARQSLVESRNEENSLRQKLSQSRQLLNDRAGQLNDLRAQIEEMTLASEADAEQAVNVEELVHLRKERDALEDLVSELKSREDQWQAMDIDPGELAELQRRFEVAVEKVRDLKVRNMELESRLSELQSAADAGGEGDWETQKQRLLERLERGGDSNDPATEHEAVDVDTGSPAVAEHDELEDERAELRKLQDEWREKLRSAEVEISIERAENSRARIELLDQVRELEEQLNLARESSGDGSKEKPRRRWLERLGLAEDDS